MSNTDELTVRELIDMQTISENHINHFIEGVIKVFEKTAKIKVKSFHINHINTEDFETKESNHIIQTKLILDFDNF